jgi:hypothetical protein
MASKQRYSDEFRADALAALAANGGNLNKTALELRVPWKTLKNWASGARHPEASQMAQNKMGHLADTLERVAFLLAGDLQDAARRERANVTQVATALGIVVDKMQVLRGQPTDISSNLTDAERATRIRLAIEAFSRDCEREEIGGPGPGDSRPAEIVGTIPGPPAGNSLPQ